MSIAASLSVTVRFAPSPTGLLHVGNARVALINQLFARRHGGSFLLRLDDTDPERSRPEFAAAIEEDLTWLGLSWNRLERQSDRLSRYRQVLEQWQKEGRVYPCHETAEELELRRRGRLARGLPPIYDRAALRLSADDRRRLEAEGRKPHWRFRLEDGPIAWEDMARGPQRFEAEHLGDPVVVRADGGFLYMLPSVVDDVDMGVTHVIRGEDHVANTAVQIRLFQALGVSPPTFAHLPLLAAVDGSPLSKRMGSLSLRALREAGIEPQALAILLAGLGTGRAADPHASLADLAAGLDLAGFGRASPRFDESELRRLNARLLHETPFPAVAERLIGLGMTEADQGFWEAVRPNLETLGDALVWYRVCREERVPSLAGSQDGEDAGFLAAAAALLPPEPWDDATWKTWTRAVSEASGRKGKALFRPLRLALTGTDHGPELSTMLPLIGRRRALLRLGLSPDR